MPDIENLMQEWQPQFEEALKEVRNIKSRLAMREFTLCGACVNVKRLNLVVHVYRDLQVGWGTQAELKITHAYIIDHSLEVQLCTSCGYQLKL